MTFLFYGFELLVFAAFCYIICKMDRVIGQQDQMIKKVLAANKKFNEQNQELVHRLLVFDENAVIAKDGSKVVRVPIKKPYEPGDWIDKEDD